MGSVRKSEYLPPGPPQRIPLGVVAPHDMALDAELWRWVPPEASLFFARTPHSPLPVNLTMVSHLSDSVGLRAAAEQLKAIGPLAYAFACTSASFVHGLAGERASAAALTEAGGATGITTSGALVSALTHLGATRVAVATPYDVTITAKLASYLDEYGIAVTGASYLGLDRHMWQVPYSRTADLIRDADTCDAEAIIVSCTNLPTYDLIAPLERELGKPIVSANQATMWALLGLAGLSAVGDQQRLLASRDELSTG